MKILLFFLVLVVALSGCATFQQLDTGLNGLMGLHESSAFRALGYPSVERKFKDKTIYIWSVNKSGTIYLPQTTTTYGVVGNAPVSTFVTQNRPMAYSHNCTILLVADENDTLIDWEYDGNIGGCSKYIGKLNKLGLTGN